MEKEGLISYKIELNQLFEDRLECERYERIEK